VDQKAQGRVWPREFAKGRARLMPLARASADLDKLAAETGALALPVEADSLVSCCPC